MELFASFTVVVALLVVFVSFSLKIFRAIHYARRLNKSDLPRFKFPIILEIIRSAQKFVTNSRLVHKRRLMFQVICGYSYVFFKDGMWLFWGSLKPILMLISPQTVEAVLNSSESLEKGFEYEFLSSWLKQGLLTSKGEKWRYRRKLLTPAFHFRTLDEYLPVFNEQSRILCQKLRNEMKQNEWTNIAPLVSLCTLDIICETAMGIKINAQSNSSLPYVKALHSACQSAIDRILQPWLWSDFIYYRTSKGKKYRDCMQTMDTFTRKVVAERKAEMLLKRIGTAEENVSVEKQEGKDCYSKMEDDIGRKYHKRLALLDILLDVHLKEPSFTLEDIAEEVDNFMFAGHDTTSSGLGFAIYMLGLYPEIQAKVREEINEVLGYDYDRAIVLDDLKEMKYLDRVLKETRRLFPPTPFIARTLTTDVNINGYLVPKDTNVGILIHMLHRNPDVFPNPEKFDPDRFLPENVSGRHPFAYVPFSAGPRNCIGQRFATFEALIVLATVVRFFDIKSRDHMDKIFVVDEIVLRSESGLYVKFAPRPECLDSNIWSRQNGTTQVFGEQVN